MNSKLLSSVVLTVSLLSISLPLAHAAGTFQLLNVPTSTTVIVNQQYGFYVNFLYSGDNVPSFSFIGNPLPYGLTAGAVSYGANGLDSVQLTGKSFNIGDYPLTLELTDNDGAFLTQPFDFTVAQALPANAHAITTTAWACNDGYVSNGVATGPNAGCQLPPNGSLVGGQLVCSPGYVDYNHSGSCSLASDLANDLCYADTGYNKGDGSSFGSFNASGTITCNCPPSYVWNGVTNRCDAESASAAAAVTPVAIVPSADSNQETATTTMPSFAPIAKNLQVGASGSNVANLQTFLEVKGFLTMPAGTAAGYFGGLTKQALIAFQKSVGLPDSGYCGPMTRAAINGG